MSSAPRSVTWSPDPHTLAKHDILRRYLQAWMAILPHGGFPRVLYVDGFAGPGVYESGDSGSPVIALQAAIAHAPNHFKNIELYLVEANKGRAAVLEEHLSRIDRPRNVSITVAAGEEFITAFPPYWRSLREAPGEAPATFAFIDPFGWTGFPFEVVQSILRSPNCEVLINLMHEDIHRFLSHPQQPANFDILFGDKSWRKFQELKNSDRALAIEELYADQLRSCCKYVRTFRMINDRNKIDYILYHATNSYLGLRKMKEAMWKVDPVAGGRFSDATDPNQLVLFGGTPDLSLLTRQITRRYNQGSAVALDELYRFVLVETPYLVKHAREVLRHLERAEPAKVVLARTPLGRRKGDFPENRGIELQFLS